jgi:hypothetical protein
VKLPQQLAQVLGLPLQPRLTSSSKLRRESGSVTCSASVGPARRPRDPWAPRDAEGGLDPARLSRQRRGKESLAYIPNSASALERGSALLLADLRGTGELAASKKGWTFAVSLLLGENFVGRQAMDFVGGWRALRGLPELSGKPIYLMGSDPSWRRPPSMPRPRAAYRRRDDGRAGRILPRLRRSPDCRRILRPCPTRRGEDRQNGRPSSRRR